MDLYSSLVLMTAFGTVAFLIKLVLMLMGSDGDYEVDDADFGDGSDSTKSFLLISTQTIFAAFMMGGLFGLTAMESTDNVMHVLGYTALGAFVGGGVSSMMMSALRKLNSASKKQEPKVGDIGLTYVPVGETHGQVIMVLGERHEVYEAVSESGLTIPSFAQVQIVGMVNNKLIVTDQIREA